MRWKYFGVTDVSVGHSFGEILAIYASGAIDFETVIGLTHIRAKLMKK